jgi:hypothetical protein
LGGPNKKTTGAILLVLLLSARAAIGDAVKAVVVPERIAQHSRIASSDEVMMMFRSIFFCLTVFVAYSQMTGIDQFCVIRVIRAPF